MQPHLFHEIDFTRQKIDQINKVTIYWFGLNIQFYLWSWIRDLETTEV